MAGWGRNPVVEGLQWTSEDLAAITERATLCRGLGRSYGDASLPAGADFPVADATLADRLLGFDPASGLLRAEAGVSLLTLNQVFRSRGWFVPVTPGTQFVTIGGMIASDVHGKNHHVDGCFGEHVRSIRLRVGDGRIVECSEASERELFLATIGGMGLTGHILEAEFQMRQIPSPWIWGRERADRPSRRTMVAGLKQAARDWPMTVGWVDCLARGATLGRGILMKGRWASPDEAPEMRPSAKRHFRIPYRFPGFALCKPSMKAFNLAYFWKHIQRVRRGHRPPRLVLLPVGRGGRLEPDLWPPWIHPVPVCVAPCRRQRPRSTSSGAVCRGRRNGGSCASIKDCGAEGRGMLSFPRPGVSIALDFPIDPQKTASDGRSAQ